MPQIIIQTDEGHTIDKFHFSTDSDYALYQIPGCPAHTGVHDLLNWTRRTLEDACRVQRRFNEERARAEAKS